MTDDIRPLSPTMMTLLRRTVERHERTLLPLVDTVGEIALNESDREALRGLVLSEFLEAGRDGTDEPTSFGLELEQLVDALGHC
jgi:hypothetical protein